MTIVPPWLHESGSQLPPDNNNEQPCLQQPGAVAILEICTVTLHSHAGFIQTPDQTEVRCEVGEGHRMSSRNLLHILSQTFVLFFFGLICLTAAGDRCSSFNKRTKKNSKGKQKRSYFLQTFGSWLSEFNVVQQKNTLVKKA